MENTVAQSKTEKKVSKIDKFLSKFGVYAVLTIIVFAIFLIMLNIVDAYPFGDLSIANYDYLAQTAPFMEHFYDVLTGKTQLFYSYNVMGGADMFQSLMFMMLSPFTPIFLLFGRTNTIYAVSLVLPLKISAIGWSALYYIRKRFPNIGSVAAVAISLIYGYCGYAISSNTYINWMDFLIYMPFIALGFKKLVETGSVKMHAIASTCLIYTCFSIASFSYFIIFPLYFIYTIIMVEKDKRKKVYSNIVISTVYTVLASLPLLIPCLISSASSSRSTSLTANLDQDIATGLSNMYVKLTYIVSDTFMVIFGLFYIIKNRKSKMGKFLLASGIMIMFPVVVDEACILLNAGSYNSYALRFGFLNAFFSLFTCCLCLEKLDFKSLFHKECQVVTPIKESKQIEQPQEQTASTSGNSMSVSDAFGSLTIVKFIKANYKNKKFIYSVIATVFFAIATVWFSIKLYDLFKGANDLHINDMRDGEFDSQFAHSEGGFSVTIWIFAFALVLSVIAYLLFKHKLITAKILSAILIIFVIGQSAFYMGSTTGGNLFNPVRYEYYEDFTNELKANDEDFEYYRVKDYKEYVNNNVSIPYNTRALTVFSSNIDEASFKTTDFFHYTEPSPGRNNAISKGKDLFGDCLLGYKYWMMFKNDAFSDPHEGTNSPGYRTEYLKECNLTAGVYNDEFTVYENTAALPSAFWTTSSTPLNMTGEDYCKDLQTLYNFLGGKKDLFEVHELDMTQTDSAKNLYSVNIPQNWDGVYYLHSDTRGGFEQKTKFYGYCTDQKSAWSYYSNLSYSAAKDIVDTVKIWLMPPERMTELHDLIMNNNRMIKYSQNMTGIKFSVTPDQTQIKEGEKVYVVLTNVLLDGHQLKVNGSKSSFIENPTGLMVFELEEGKNSVQIKYVSSYPIIGIVIALVCVGLIIGLTILRRKTKFFENNITQNTLYYGGMVISLALICVFMIYPLTLFMEKAFLKTQIGRIFYGK